MSEPIINNLRVVPRASDFLDRKLGSRGEIFFDQTTNTLRLYNGQVTGGIQLAKADLINVTNAVNEAFAEDASLQLAEVPQEVVEEEPKKKSKKSTMTAGVVEEDTKTNTDEESI